MVCFNEYEDNKSFNIPIAKGTRHTQRSEILKLAEALNPDSNIKGQLLNYPYTAYYLIWVDEEGAEVDVEHEDLPEPAKYKGGRINSDGVFLFKGKSKATHKLIIDEDNMTSEYKEMIYY